VNECLACSQSKQPAPISQRWPLVASLLALGLAACGSPQQDTGEIVRVGSLSAPGTPWHDEWLRFQTTFDAQPDSGLTLNLFITGQLGSEETVLSNLRRGRVQLGGFSLHGLASVVPELSVLLAPYLFESRAEVDFIMDNYLTEIFTTLFAEQGITLLRWSEVGWNHVFCREPVIVPADIRGLKMRASSAIGPQEFARRVGADNVPVNYAELITALQTGLLDCGQGGVGLYALGGIAQEAPHLTLTYHIFDTGLVVANKAWLDGLTDPQRDAILASLEPTTIGREKLRAALARIQNEQLGDLGVIVHDLEPEQRAAWEDAAMGSHAAVVAETGGRAQEVYELILAGKRDFKAQQPAAQAAQ
jgi:TRAP-type C4-dicarboxylate transport system substrate-binding protein